MKQDGEKIADALHDVFVSPAELDARFESANVVDGLFAIARALNRMAKAMEDRHVKVAGGTKPEVHTSGNGRA